MSNIDILKKTKEALDKAIADKRISQEMVRNLSPAIIETLTPILQEIATNSRLTKEDIISALSQIKIDVPKSEVDVKIPTITVPEAHVKVEMPKIEIPEVKVNIPEIKIPKIVVPKPEVTVNVPPIKIPKMEWPEGNMPIDGLVSLKGISRTNPLPVELRDAVGNPISFPEYIGGGSGGLARNVKIGGFSQSAYADYLNADGRLRVSVETGGSGLTDAELRAAHLDVQQLSGSEDSVVVNNTVTVNQLSGATWSVSVNDAFRTTVVSNLINSDDRLRVSVETGGSGLTDAELRATAVSVSQLSGASWSVEATATDLDIRNLANATDLISAYQISGHSWSTEATQAGTWNIGTVTTVTGITNSIAANVVDSGGIPYTTTNPLPVGDAGGSLTIDGSVSVSGSVTSTVATGVTLHDAADDGDAPLKIGGVAVTANPTAVAGGDRVKATFDDVGRQLVRPFQVRDLIQTAYATLTTGTETTLLAGSASTFHDLVYCMFANSSDAAVLVDVRAGTANGVLATVHVPASSMSGFSPKIPIPQDVAANAWTVDMPDITGTTVYVSALFSKEV